MKPEAMVLTQRAEVPTRSVFVCVRLGMEEDDGSGSWFYLTAEEARTLAGELSVVASEAEELVRLLKEGGEEVVT
jgi:hypothetical protein